MNYVDKIQDRDGTDYALKATIESVSAIAESVAATAPVSVTAAVDDGAISFDFEIPQASTANADAAAAEARAAASACETATIAANTAANGATTAAQNAVEATVETVNATNAARTATTATVQATEAAQTATAAADVAKAGADNAASAAGSAADAANAAATASTTATSAANAATTAANSAATAATSAASAANTAAEHAEDAAQAVVSDFTGATASAAGAHGLVPAPAAGEETHALTGDGTWGVDLDYKADIDGYYELLTAGAADNLTGRGDSVEGSFLYRTAGGDADIADGIATIECIKGNTVGWNQKCKMPTASEPWSKPNAMVGVEYPGVNQVKLTSLADSSNFKRIELYNDPIPNGHVGLLVANIDSTGLTGSNTSAYLCVTTLSSRTTYASAGVEAGVSKTRVSQIFTNSSGGALRLTISLGSATLSEQYATFSDCMCFDLTKIFGTGKEPATVEEFEALYPEPYYPYDPGTLKPVMFEGMETVGFNQWDEIMEEGGYSSYDGQKTYSAAYLRSANRIPVLPGQVYEIARPDGVTLYTYCYDAAGNYLAIPLVHTPNTKLETVPANVYYFTFSVTKSQYGNQYNNDICVHLRWSGYRDGEYEAYWKAQREIAIAEHFPTGMWSNGVYFDELTKSEAIKRIKVGTVTSLGNITTNGGRKFVGLYGPGSDSWPSSSAFPNDASWVWSPITGRTNASSSTTSLVLNRTWTGLYAYAPSTADDTIFDQLIGTPIAFVMATPTVTPIDPPLNLGYKVSDFGTERVMLGDGVISAPPIFEISYGLNAVDTIRRLPTEYISHDSFEQFLDEAYGTGTVTETWDAVNNRYTYAITTLDADTIAAVVDEEWRD